MWEMAMGLGGKTLLLFLVLAWFDWGSGGGYVLCFYGRGVEMGFLMA